MKKEIIIAILSTAIVVFVILALIGLATEERPSQTYVGGQQEAITKITEEEDFKNGFMEGCAEEATYRECECAYSVMENKFGEEAIVNMSLEYLNTGYMREDILLSTLVCWE